MSRAVAGHAASIGIAGALSFLCAGSAEQRWLGWRGAFAGAAGAAAIAWLIVLMWAPAQPRRGDAPRAGALFDFRPVLRNRSAMAYAVAYCAHTWEMNALRGWAVAFLAYVAGVTGERSPWIAPTVVATAMGLIGTWASVTGNEVSIRLGRQRLVRLAMTSCVACGAVVGFLGARWYPSPPPSCSSTACSSGSILPRSRRAPPAAPIRAGGRHAGGALDGRLCGRLRRPPDARMDPRSIRRDVGDRVGPRVSPRRRRRARSARSDSWRSGRATSPATSRSAPPRRELALQLSARVLRRPTSAGLTTSAIGRAASSGSAHGESRPPSTGTPATPGADTRRSLVTDAPEGLEPLVFRPGGTGRVSKLQCRRRTVRERWGSVRSRCHIP